MIKSLILLLLAIYLSAGVCYSQKSMEGARPILFRGIVFDASNQSRLPGSSILVNRILSALSAENGAFSFYAGKKDTVVFTMMGYKSATLIVNDTLTAAEFLTGVYLQTDTILIGEVIIVPKLPNLKAEMMNPRVTTDIKTENARSNISIATYQGKTSQGKLGDPAINYEMMRQKQKIDAYERGGIPSDKMVAISPLLLIPAVYLLIHGVPETPPPPKSQISSKEMDELQKMYQELLKNRK
jgi:hypothetical protein